MSTANIQAIYPLTPVQEGILFHTLYAPESPLYIQQYTAQLDGDLNGDAFRQAWDIVIGRHAVLRSLLTWEGRERPLQLVRSSVTTEWRVEDWSDDASTHESRLDMFLIDDRTRGFVLDEAPLMRFALFTLSDRTTRFVWSHHHIIIDGWSMGIVLDEVMRAYEAIVRGTQPDLAPVADYRRYVTWLHESNSTDDEAWWRSRLDGVTTRTPLPIDKTTLDSPWAERHSESVVRLDRVSTAQLKEFARSNGVTLNTLVRGAWTMVLSRYSGRDDVVYGATVSGRPADVEGALEMVGLFINTLPVRATVDTTTPVSAWLKEIQEQQIAMAPYESTPLVDVQRWSDVTKNEPLFTSLLVFENVPAPAAVESGLTSSDVRYLQRSNYPLAILVLPGDELEFILLYDADRYPVEIIERLAGQLLHTVKALAADSNRAIGAIDVMPTSERDEILVQWNDTDASYPADATMWDLISATASAEPERLAVIAADAELTYAALINRAAVVAEHLAGIGVVPNDRVAIVAERSAAMVVAIVGALASGAAYVPIDPNSPAARLETLVRNTASRALITDGSAGPTDIATITLGAGGTIVEAPSTRSSVTASANPDDLAYVLYTSGSTGEPKGVAVTNRNLVNSTNARLLAYGGPVERFLLLSPFYFDSSIAGIFSSMSQGGTLVLPAPDMEKDVVELGALIAHHAVTHALALPSLYDLLLRHARDDLATLRLVMVAGEPCAPAVVERHFATIPKARLVNEYGPTEATVWCTVHEVTARDAERRVPIGRPIANTKAFVLDTSRRPVPVGVPGELHIGGLNVTQGYLGRADLTDERFHEIVLGDLDAQRMYSTGDMARWLPDGTLDLIGRIDHQVKIRGQRIELGEIEAVLRLHPSVRDAVAVVVDSMVVVYVEPAVSVDDVRQHAAGQLPGVMVPSVIVSLDVLPRGRTGKVARDELPDVELATPDDADHVAPETDVEKALAEIWTAVLNVEQVGLTDNFFDLGGDSILSIRIIARAHERGIRLTPRQFLAAPTVREQAKLSQN